MPCPTREPSRLPMRSGLPEQQRKVVVLRYWLDQSVSETADQLRIGEGTVKSHAARGIGALRDALTESEINTP